ncbi:MucBP domain-containing protein [Secundilactobacillus muriivasis]
MTMGKNRAQHGKWLSTLTVCTAALGSLVLLSVPQMASAATTDTSSATTGAALTGAQPAATTDTSAAESNPETAQPAGTTSTEEQPAADTTNTPTTAESTTNTDQLKTTSADLQTAVDTAKTTGVVVTQNPTETKTTTPDQLADTVSSVKADNDAQAQALADATAKQVVNQKDYDDAKAKVQAGTKTITSTNAAWSNNQIIKLLTGNGDVMKSGSTTDVLTGAQISEATEADKVAASDEAKVASTVTLEAGHKLVSTWNQDQQMGEGNWPTWTYENAFTDTKTGRKINVVETVTGFTQLNEATAENKIKKIDSDDIGFQPTNIENVTATLKYVYADTGESATIDAILAFSDIDGEQGITVNNGYASMLIGDEIIYTDDDVYRTTTNENHPKTDPSNQIWVLQKDVTETSYTFYVGLDWDDGKTASNKDPEQSVGGVAFSAALPKVEPLVQEKATYTPTTIQVTTNYTVHYEGAGTATPADVTKSVTWTGNYDSATDTYTWTPDNNAITAVTPVVNDYGAIVSTGWNLNTKSADPTDQTQTVTYYQVGKVPNNNTTTNLTVHFVDTEGAEIHPNLAASGKVGSEFTQAPAVIDGYRTADKKVSGTYHGTTMDLTFTYVKDGVVPDGKVATLTVHYVDGNGNKITGDKKTHGALGTDFTSTPQKFEGYVTTDKAVSGHYNGNNMDLTFTYFKTGLPTETQPVTLTVHYVDEHGNPVAEDATANGAIDDDFTQTPKQVKGYTTADKPVTGTFKGNNMDLTFTYTKDGQVATNTTTGLIVHYVDEHGNELIPATSQGGQIGTGFTANAPEISGYTPMSQKTVTGKYQGNQMVLYFVYTPNPIDTTTGTPIGKTTDTPTNTTTETATSTPTTPVTGTTTETPTSANGTAVAGDPTPTTPETTTNSQQNATSQASQGTNGQYHLVASTANAQHATWQYAKTQATGQRTSNSAAATAQLPQTSDQTGTASTLLGLGLMSLFLGMFGITRRKRQG